MTDFRRPKHRRKGEENGRIDWRNLFHYLFNSLIQGILFTAILFTVFMIGRHYDFMSKQSTIDPMTIYKEYKAYHVGSH